MQFGFCSGLDDENLSKLKQIFVLGLELLTYSKENNKMLMLRGGAKFPTGGIVHDHACVLMR